MILAGYVSFAAVGYWSGHLSNVFGGIGDLGLNVTTSVGGRLQGVRRSMSGPACQVVVAALIVGLAASGWRDAEGRESTTGVLLALLLVPVLVGLVSYGGEIALRTYLFMLPPASLFGALLFFPRPLRAVGPRSRPDWRDPGAAACAVVLPGTFFLARYGNEAYEQMPPGELAATNWIYAHDAHGVRLLWLSTDPVTDVTPQMPWSYGTSQGRLRPVLAPLDPAQVGGLVSDLRRAGPGSYLIATRTQISGDAGDRQLRV